MAEVIYITTKILLTGLVLLALLSVPSLAQNGMVNQTLMNNTIGSTNQTIAVHQGDQANQAMTANQTTTLSAQRSAALLYSSQQFLPSYSSTNKYQISAENLNTNISQNSPNLLILDVDPVAIWNSIGHISGATNIPIDTLDIRLNDIPSNKMIAVFSNNCQDAAVAMTFLRMSGYDAYVVQGDLSSWTQAGYQIVGGSGTATSAEVTAKSSQATAGEAATSQTTAGQAATSQTTSGQATKVTTNVSSFSGTATGNRLPVLNLP